MAWYQNRTVIAATIGGSCALAAAILAARSRMSEPVAATKSDARPSPPTLIQEEIAQKTVDQTGLTRGEVEVLRLLAEPNDGYWYTPTPVALRLKMHPDEVRYAAESLYKRGLVAKVIRGDDEPGFWIRDEGRSLLAAHHLLDQ